MIESNDASGYSNLSSKGQGSAGSRIVIRIEERQRQRVPVQLGVRLDDIPYEEADIIVELTVSSDCFKIVELIVRRYVHVQDASASRKARERIEAQDGRFAGKLLKAGGDERGSSTFIYSELGYVAGYSAR